MDLLGTFWQRDAGPCCALLRLGSNPRRFDGASRPCATSGPHHLPARPLALQ